MPNKKLTPRQINAARKRDGLPPLNFRLFRKVIAKLEAAPEAYDQGDVLRDEPEAPCGTAGCIGGWAYLLNGHPLGKNHYKVLDIAARDLGLAASGEWDDWDNDSRIVFAGSPAVRWPHPYASQWAVAYTAKKRARVAIRYLNHIISTGKVTE